MLDRVRGWMICIGVVDHLFGGARWPPPQSSTTRQTALFATKSDFAFISMDFMVIFHAPLLFLVFYDFPASSALPQKIRAKLLFWIQFNLMSWIVDTWRVTGDEVILLQTSNRMKSNLFLENVCNIDPWRIGPVLNMLVLDWTHYYVKQQYPCCKWMRGDE